MAQFLRHVIAPPHLRDTHVLARIGKSLFIAGREHQLACPCTDIYQQAVQNAASLELLLHLEVHAVLVEMSVQGTNQHTCLGIRLVSHKALLEPHFHSEKALLECGLLFYTAY